MLQNNSSIKSMWGAVSLLAIFILILLGAGLLGGFNFVMAKTNTMEFCISCHEMENNVYREYQETVHFKNVSGVKVTCADCHVPESWFPKVIRKTKATIELYYKMTGKIDTPEKFEKHRWEMANRVWDEMKSNNSRECRNCHDYSSMDLDEQDRSANRRHSRAIEEGETCIDCHKGIAYKEPDEPEKEGAGVNRAR